MAAPRVTALVFCKRAVYVEPWWNLIGEFSELLCRHRETYEFDAFLRLGSAPPDKRMDVTLRLVEPRELEVIEDIQRSVWADRDSLATAVFSFNSQFLEEGRYHVEVVVDGRLIDAVLLPVVLL